MTTNTNLMVHISPMCRICLKSNRKAYNIFSKFYERDTANMISEAIMMIANVQISQSDKFPKVICEYCVRDLQAASRFKKTCEKSNKLLKDYEIQFMLDNYEEETPAKTSSPVDDIKKILRENIMNLLNLQKPSIENIPKSIEVDLNQDNSLRNRVKAEVELQSTSDGVLKNSPEQESSTSNDMATAQEIQLKTNTELQLATDSASQIKLQPKLATSNSNITIQKDHLMAQLQSETENILTIDLETELESFNNIVDVQEEPIIIIDDDTLTSKDSNKRKFDTQSDNNTDRYKKHKMSEPLKARVIQGRRGGFCKSDMYQRKVTLDLTNFSGKNQGIKYNVISGNSNLKIPITLSSISFRNEFLIGDPTETETTFADTNNPIRPSVIIPGIMQNAVLQKETENTTQISEKFKNSSNMNIQDHNKILRTSLCSSNVNINNLEDRQPMQRMSNMIKELLDTSTMSVPISSNRTTFTNMGINYTSPPNVTTTQSFPIHLEGLESTPIESLAVIPTNGNTNSTLRTNSVAIDLTDDDLVIRPHKQSSKKSNESYAKSATSVKLVHTRRTYSNTANTTQHKITSKNSSTITDYNPHQGTALQQTCVFQSNLNSQAEYGQVSKNTSSIQNGTAFTTATDIPTFQFQTFTPSVNVNPTSSTEYYLQELAKIQSQKGATLNQPVYNNVQRQPPQYETLFPSDIQQIQTTQYGSHNANNQVYQYAIPQNTAQIIANEMHKSANPGFYEEQQNISNTNSMQIQIVSVESLSTDTSQITIPVPVYTSATNNVDNNLYFLNNNTNINDNVIIQPTSYTYLHNNQTNDKNERYILPDSAVNDISNPNSVNSFGTIKVRNITDLI